MSNSWEKQEDKKVKAFETAKYLVTVCRRKLLLCLRLDIRQEASNMKNESVRACLCVCACVFVCLKGITSHEANSTVTSMALTNPKQARSVLRRLVWRRLPLHRLTRKKRKENYFSLQLQRNFFHSKSPMLELHYEPWLPLHLGCRLSRCNLRCHTVTLNRRQWSPDTSKSHQTFAVWDENKKNIWDSRNDVEGK